MAVALDLRTLALTTLLFSLVFGVGLTAYARANPQFRGIHLVGLGFLTVGSGYVLLGLRNIVPDLISIVLANGLILLGLYFVLRGLARFLELRLGRLDVTLAVSLPLVLAGLAYFTYIDFDVNARILLFSVATAGLFFMSATGLGAYDKCYGNKAVTFLRIMFWAFSLFYLFRAIWTLNEPAMSTFMDAGFIHGITVVASQSVVLLTSFCIIWIGTDALREELEKLASIDPLTEVFNRRTFERCCELETARWQRSGSFFTLIITDIDYFKQVNDTFGHGFGDQVLVEFAKRISSEVRLQDSVARYGGEEFVILLPQTDLNAGIGVAEKLRKAVEKLDFAPQNNERVHITASFGVATIDSRDQNWESLMLLADQALYAAKKAGRNRVMSRLDMHSEEKPSASFSENRP